MNTGNRMTYRLIQAALALALVAICAPDAGAQTYPNRPVRMIAPFPAGGSPMCWRARSATR